MPTDTGQEALNLSTNEGNTNSTAPPVETNVTVHPQPLLGRPVPPLPTDADLIQTVTEEENIYNSPEARSSGSELSGGASGTSTVEQGLRVYEGLSEEAQDEMYKQINATRNQRLYPSNMLNEEINRIKDYASDVEETKDFLEHGLGIVQVQQDDLNTASSLHQKRYTTAEKEKTISKDLNKVKLMETKVKRVLDDLGKVLKGEVTDEAEIGKILKESQTIGQKDQKKKPDVIYSQVAKGKTMKVRYADVSKQEDSSDEFQDATDEINAGLEEEEEEAPATQQTRKKQFSKRVSKPGSNGGGVQKVPPQVKESYSEGSSRYEKVIMGMEEAIENATEVLEDEGSAKIKLSNAMDELKNCLKMAKQTRVDHDPPNSAIGRTMNNKIRETSSLVNEVADKIEKFNNDETLRKMLPQGSWPKWSGNQEEFLDFITTMKAHLPALKTDKLQLSTLKDHITGPNMKVWIKNNLAGVSTLNEAFKILEDKFGNIVKHLPNMLQKLLDLKQTQSEPTNPVDEHENVSALLSYCRTCIQYGAKSKINNLFLVEYQSLLSQNTKLNVLFPLAKQGEWHQENIDFSDDFVVFLVELQNNLEDLDSVREKLLKDLEKKNNHPLKHQNSRMNNMNRTPYPKKHAPCHLCQTQEHTLLNCPVLKKSTPEARKKLFESKNMCIQCLREKREDPGRFHYCSSSIIRQFFCKNHKTNVAICGCKTFQSKRNGIVEGRVANNSNFLKSNNMSGFTNTSLIFEIVYFVNDAGEEYPTLQLYDSGNSNMSLDSEETNRRYGFLPLTHTFKIDNIAKGATQTRGNRRVVKLKTMNGIEELTVFTIEKLGQRYEQSSFKVPDTWVKKYNIRKYPTTPAGIATSVVGMDTPHLMPEHLETSSDGVCLYKSRVTGNYIVAGRTLEQGDQIRNNALKMAHVRPIEDLNNQDVTNFISTDGVESSRLIKCSRCILMNSKCQECKKSHKPVPKEQAEWEDAVKMNIEYRKEEKRYFCKYIYNRELENLPENKEAALRMSMIFQKKIDQAGITDAINKTYTKYRKTGVIVLDSEKPLDPKLKVSYITPTFALASSDFKNTKVRLCMNSGFKKRENEISLNEAMVAGPQYLNDLHGVLTRWRTYDCVAYADITSCYHQVWSCDEDKALRHIWVKPTQFGKENNEEWTTAYCTCCQFGDKLAGAMCAFCIADCSERFMTAKNSKMVKDNIIMDDLMIGERKTYDKQDKLQDLKEAVQDINEGLNEGSLGVKEWTMTGEDKPPMKYLSYITDPKEDNISLRTNVNWSKIKRGARTGPSLTKPEDIDEYMKIYPLTKKAIASVVMGCVHDPLGLADPYKNNFKYIFRSISGKDLEWKDEVDDDIKAEMKKALTTFLNMGDFKVPRQCVFSDAKEINFILYFDGSLSGVGVSTVVKNVFTDKEPILRVLKNKSKITGADCQTAPRAELMSCLLASRVYDILNVELKEFLDTYEGEIKFQFVGDSTIVLSQIKQQAHKFKMWCQSKIQEIQELTKKTDKITPEFYHCKSEDNISDILTRPYHGKGLPWQHDLPDIELKTLDAAENIAELPEINSKSLKINVMKVTQDEDVTLTDIALYGMFNNSMKQSQIEPDEEDDSVINKIMTKQSNYFKAKNTIARILDMKRRKCDNVDNMAQAQIDAEKLIFKHYQEKKKDYVKRFQGHIYTKTEEDGLVVLRGRKTPKGKTSMKLVPKDTLLFQRITHTYHSQHKYDSAEAVSTQLIKDGYYVPGLVQRLQTLQKKCPACRRRKLKTDPPEMGRLGDKRLIPSKPFTAMQMDLCGPFAVKSFAKQRTTRKAWILVGICDYTRLISLTMVESLSMDHLLLAIKAHFARYGLSSRIESDLGTNFVAAAKQINEPADTLEDGDITLLTRELRSQGCNMVQRCPRTPYLQGSAEHAVKLTKKALKVYKSALTSFSWVNLLEKTMAILNRRPIGARTTGEVLTPSDVNSVFSGVNEKIDVDPNMGDLPRYSQQVAELQEDFKEQWLSLYYKTLLRQKKWVERNQILQEGDLVLILDLPNENHYPTLGRIIHIEKDGGDIERYFSIQYKKSSGTLKTVQRTPTSLTLVLKATEDQTVDKFDIYDDPDNISAPPQPAAADPEPAAADPEPVDDIPGPVVADPEPAAVVPEPVTDPEPEKNSVPNSEPRRSNRLQKKPKLQVKYQRAPHDRIVDI